MKVEKIPQPHLLTAADTSDSLKAKKLKTDENVETHNSFGDGQIDVETSVPSSCSLPDCPNSETLSEPGSMLRLITPVRDSDQIGTRSSSADGDGHGSSGQQSTGAKESSAVNDEASVGVEELGTDAGCQSNELPTKSAVGDTAGPTEQLSQRQEVVRPKLISVRHVSDMPDQNCKTQ